MKTKLKKSKKKTNKFSKTSSNRELIWKEDPFCYLQQIKQSNDVFVRKSATSGVKLKKWEINSNIYITKGFQSYLAIKLITFNINIVFVCIVVCSILARKDLRKGCIKILRTIVCLIRIVIAAICWANWEICQFRNKIIHQWECCTSHHKNLQLFLVDCNQPHRLKNYILCSMQL